MGDILFLAHRVPFPPDRGDKIRAYHILKHLAAHRRVHLVTFAESSHDMKAKGGLDRLTANRSIFWRSKTRARAVLEALVSGQAASVTAFRHPMVPGAVRALLARHAIDTIYVFSSQMAQYLPPPSPRRRVVMDFVDVDSAKFADYAKGARWPMSWLYRREASALLAHDRAVATRADLSLFVSEAEAALFRARTGAERVHAVENGIDADRFAPDADFRRIESQGQLIVFTGQMDYPPNVEAVTWFARSVLPHIRLRHPDARFAIVGRNPTAEVEAFARGEGVIVTGEVPDVRGWLAAAAVVVAPLKLARGVQNKVLEAMAMARPVVVSGAAAEGIDHDGTICVADDVAGIADAVVALLDDPDQAEELGRSAREQVKRRYGWEARLAVLDELLGLTPRRQRRSAAA
ncbi:TIGR03087 family PEP-CTERM/XrtA system glycosyltransferase [Sphingomonas cannabina]|uniref:TIGR03087 family PEP-CTERM/XrtA system glycosyltransferase n=1 Tax=Sphingomonas cannabina TaxID=2899123 RepID=UPI001F38AE27|nr:TIGR03087 family PEP-CTERM/XrtA system glycosyltransferase [Sphingomonas cannabina]UIJ43554.1 TIGR03087 family PEP-CTERM/XrtA system glycosyltransferase [Sphingomonas cannabina]